MRFSIKSFDFYKKLPVDVSNFILPVISKYTNISVSLTPTYVPISLHHS